jgi:hypothetical protein
MTVKSCEMRVRILAETRSRRFLADSAATERGLPF